MNECHVVKVRFSDGDEIVTKMIASERRIREYYRIGNIFNLGTCEDRLVKVVSVEIIA